MEAIMDEERIAFIAVITELVLRYGIPAALDILREFKVERPTLEDIRALKNRVPHPDTY